ncbi:MAG: MBL fold metallo-hydrolase [Clostridia bacterium]|nr:MBL fold metallo-hydrolase [Clostridia bacterium]
MTLLFAPLFSGSSGNCTYVGTEDEGVIVDCGVSAMATLEQLKAAKIDPAAVKAVLVTHEHTDHVSGVGVLSRRLGGVPIYATRGTWDGSGKRLGKLAPEQIRYIDNDSDFFIGDLNITAFTTPHDCLDPCGFVFEKGGVKAAVATDMGYINKTWLEAVGGSDLVLLEADYDTDMLMAGSYPYDLKRRILGRKGHLSNEDAGSAAAHLIKSGAREIILGHLSKNNNFPELALKTCENMLLDEGIRPGRDMELHVAARSALTGVFKIEL